MGPSIFEKTMCMGRSVWCFREESMDYKKVQRFELFCQSFSLHLPAKPKGELQYVSTELYNQRCCMYVQQDYSCKGYFLFMNEVTKVL